MFLELTFELKEASETYLKTLFGAPNDPTVVSKLFEVSFWGPNDPIVVSKPGWLLAFGIAEVCLLLVSSRFASWYVN